MVVVGDAEKVANILNVWIMSISVFEYCGSWVTMILVYQYDTHNPYAGKPYDGIE